MLNVNLQLHIILKLLLVIVLQVLINFMTIVLDVSINKLGILLQKGVNVNFSPYLKDALKTVLIISKVIKKNNVYNAKIETVTLFIFLLNLLPK